MVMVVKVEVRTRCRHGRVVSRKRMNMAVIMMGRGIASPPAVSTRPHGHGHVDTHAAHADAIGGCPRERRVTMM